MRGQDISNLFADHFGTSSPVWTFEHDSNALVLTVSGDLSEPSARISLTRSQSDEIEQLSGETKALVIEGLVLGREITLHLLGRKINLKKWAGVAALLSDSEAIAKNSMQAIAFAEGVISEVNSIVVVLDRMGTIHRFNHLAEEYTGCREAQVIGENAQALFMTPHEGQASRRNIAWFFEKGQPYDVERSIRTINGPRRFLFRNKFIPPDNGGESDLVVCSGVEVPTTHATDDKPTVADAGSPLCTENYYFQVLKRILEWAAMLDGARALLASIEDGAGDAGSLAHARTIAASAVRDAYALYEEIDAHITKGGTSRE